MKYIKELDVSDKLVFLRVDFNVPLNEDGSIRDDTRIQASLPTIEDVLNRGAKLIIASHLGRPKGKFDLKMSLKPAANRLAELIPNRVIMAPDVVGEDVDRLKGALKSGEVLVLENVRFYKEEEANSLEFSQKLAKGVEVFINDAFGSSHRAHASVVGITEFVPVKAAGYLMEKEVEALKKIVQQPEKPYVAVLGGAKVSDKIEIIESLLNKADYILIGGAMAYTFFSALGHNAGKSLIETDQQETALTTINQAKEKGVKILLPIDHILALSPDAQDGVQTIDVFPFPENMMGVDIGPKTIEKFSGIIKEAKTIFWNGPMGIFENSLFATGTTAIARAIASSSAFSVVGGGDSIAAVKKFGLKDKISHISTGGGASLEYIAYGTLPGLEALEN